MLEHVDLGLSVEPWTASTLSLRVLSLLTITNPFSSSLTSHFPFRDPSSQLFTGSLISSRTLTSPFPSLSRSWPKSRHLPKSGDLSGREHAVCHLDTFHFPLNNALQLANAWHCTNRCLTSPLYSAPARRNQLVFETRPRSGSVVRLRGLATTCAGTSYPPPPPPPDLDLTQPCLSGWAGDQQVTSIHDPKIANPAQKSMRLIYL